MLIALEMYFFRIIDSHYNEIQQHYTEKGL